MHLARSCKDRCNPMQFLAIQRGKLTKYSTQQGGKPLEVPNDSNEAEHQPGNTPNLEASDHQIHPLTTLYLLVNNIFFSEWMHLKNCRLDLRSSEDNSRGRRRQDCCRRWICLLYQLWHNRDLWCRHWLMECGWVRFYSIWIIIVNSGLCTRTSILTGAKLPRTIAHGAAVVEHKGPSINDVTH